jgi:hypothetical protein
VLSALRPSNRDREEPRGSSPPTPPHVRVTYAAVRRIQWSVRLSTRLGSPSATKYRAGSAIASAGLRLRRLCSDHRSVFSPCPRCGFIPRILQGQQKLSVGCTTASRHDGDFSSPSIPSRGTVRAFLLGRCGSAYPLPRLSASGCLTSLACLGTTLPSADFSQPLGVGCSAPSPLGQPGDLPG